MAHIINTLQPHFTGHIGLVRFVNGHAEADDADLVAFFADRPDEFEVHDEDGTPFLVDPDDETPDESDQE